MTDMLRIAFYYNHYNTLGHSTRVFSLVKGLKIRLKNQVKIVVLQGGNKQDILPFKNYCSIFILPFSIDKKGLFIEEYAKIYKRIITSGKFDNMLKARLSLIKNVLSRFKPDIFVTEYFPFGQEFWTFEVPYILKYLKDNFTCKIVGSSGYLSWTEKTYEYAREFYDLLLIHSPKEFSQDYHSYLHKEAALQLDKLFEELSDRIHFTGFVLDSNENTRKSEESIYFGKRYEKFIFVSRGGGIVNRKIILISIMTANRFKNIFFLVVCGPATSINEFDEYRKFARNMPNLKIVRVIPQDIFNHYLKYCDLSINMAGYNTTVRLLYYNKKSILVPCSTSEQKWRAALVDRYITAKVIPEKELNVRGLEASINQLLTYNNGASCVKKDWFMGIDETIEKIRCLA